MAFVTAATAVAAEDAPPPRFTLEGRLPADEVPARVSASPCASPGQAHRATTATRDGGFRFLGLEPTLWCVSAVLADGVTYGIAVPVFAPTVLPPLERAAPGRWRLLLSATAAREPQRTLTGRVVDTRGEGIAGAIVWIEDREWEVVETDDAGRYRLHTTPTADRLLVRVAALGFLPARSPSRSDGEGMTGKGPIFVLSAAAQLVGRVVDEEDDALSARVEISPESPTTAGAKGYVPPYPAVFSGLGGRFTALVAPGEEYRLEVSSPGHLGATAIAAASPGPHPGEEVLFRLATQVVVTGVAEDRAGNPVANAKISLLPRSEEERLPELLAGRPVVVRRYPEVTTDRRGRFELDGLRAGDYVLVARASGFAPYTRLEMLSAARGGELVLPAVVLQPAASLQGRVVDQEGEAVEGAEVRVSLVTSAGRAMTSRPEPTRTDRSGRFIVDDLAASQQILLTVRGEGFLPESVGPFAVSDEREVEVVLEVGSSIEGSVHDARGRPIGGATVRVSLAGGTAESQSLRGRSLRGDHPESRTDSEGAFALDAVEPGRLLLRVTADCCLPASKLVTVEPGAALRGVAVVLDEGARLEGRVLGPAGRPVANSRVGAAGKTGRSAADGSFRLVGLPPGPTRLWAEHAAYGRVETDVRTGGREAVLSFLEPAVLAGEVIDAAGHQRSGDARVFLAGDGFPGAPFLDVDATGRFRRIVQPGSYRVRAIAGARSSIEQGFVLEPGQEVRLQLALEAGAVVGGRLIGVADAELVRARVTAENGRRTNLTGRVSLDGTYSVEGLTPGRWRVVGELADGGQASADVEIEAEGRTASVDLVFGEGRSLEGQVLLDGAPLAGAWLTLLASDGQRLGRAVSRLDGRFAVGGVDERAVRIEVVSREGDVVAIRDLELATARTVIEIWTGTLAGEVLERTSGAAPRTVDLLLEGPDGPARRTRRATVAPDGRFGALRLSEGLYTVTAKASGLASASTRVEVARDRHVSLVLWLDDVR